jgi:hypothetical protein
MVQCAECQYCRIVNFYGSLQFLCEYNGAHFSAYDDGQEVECPNFKLREKPPAIGKATDKDEIEIIFKTYPPFAQVRRFSLHFE